VVNDADSNTAANMAVTPMTTSNSVKVNAPTLPVCRRRMDVNWFGYVFFMAGID
jgi:hypothetical protein